MRMKKFDIYLISVGEKEYKAPRNNFGNIFQEEKPPVRKDSFSSSTSELICVCGTQINRKDIREHGFGCVPFKKKFGTLWNTIDSHAKPGEDIQHYKLVKVLLQFFRQKIEKRITDAQPSSKINKLGVGGVGQQAHQPLQTFPPKDKDKLKEKDNLSDLQPPIGRDLRMSPPIIAGLPDPDKPPSGSSDLDMAIEGDRREEEKYCMPGAFDCNAMLVCVKCEKGFVDFEKIIYLNDCLHTVCRECLRAIIFRFSFFWLFCIFYREFLDKGEVRCPQSECSARLAEFEMRVISIFFGFF
jgi:hypothetical protein